MSIQLTTPLSVGDLDGNSPYQEAKIIDFKLFSADKRMELVVQLGNTIAGKWTPPVLSMGTITVKRFEISDTDYDTLVATQSLAVGEVYYQKVSEALYQWLLDNGHYVGTII